MSGLSVDHIVIPIRDVAASRAFYESVLGLALHSAVTGDDWEGHPWLMLHYELADGRHIVLTGFKGLKLTPEKVPLDARHYALSSTDLPGWRSKLKAAKTAFREEEHGPQQSIYFEAPEGTIWEITSPATHGVVVRGTDAGAVADAFVRG